MMMIGTGILMMVHINFGKIICIIRIIVVNVIKL